MLYLPSWKTDYLQLLSQIDRIFGDRMLHDGWEKLVDVSVGTFRISQEYMKKLRRVEPLHQRYSILMSIATGYISIHRNY